jgi:hypothetical protein
MVDSRGMQDIFGLDISKFVQGVEKFTYNFLEEFQKVKMKGDQKRFWTKNPVRIAAATSPSATKNVSPGSRPMTQEVSWTVTNVFVKKYFVEGFLDAEDISDAEIDTYGTTLQDLTERIVRDRDIDLYNIMSENQSPSAIQSFATTAVGGDQWDAANYAADIIKDFNRAIRLIQAAGFKDKIKAVMDPIAYESMKNWLISGKGSSIPGFSSEKIKSGVVMELLNVSIKVSTEAVTDNVLFTIGPRAQSYAEAEAITGNTFIDAGVGRNIRVWTRGVGYRTNPQGNVLVTDINT